MESLLLLTILATYITLSYSVDPIVYNVKELGGELIINCTDKEITRTTPWHWVLTDLSVFDENSQPAAFQLVNDGLQLRIKKVEENSIGDYFCVLRQLNNNGNISLLYFKTVVQKYEKSTWDKYETQAIVGIVAAVVTLVVMIGLCLVWRYRWIPEEQETVAVNGGYDTADAYYPPEADMEKEKGFINESFANTNPSPTHGVVIDDTKF